MTERGAASAAHGRIVIAIDGPSGTGKSTVARGVATELGLRYLDTGAMYRAVTWLALQRSLDLDDASELVELARGCRLDISTDPRHARICIDDTDVTVAIRSAAVTDAVSAVSAVAGVRTELVRRQHDEIGGGGIVVEGRDIGTTVAPQAAVKVFLTADSGTRAHRRGRELAGTDVDAGTLEATEAALRRRDTADSSRAASPLSRAEDAVVIDTSALSAADVIDRVLALVTAAVPS